MVSKQRLSIEPLDRIDDIVADLRFLGYSTPLRNTAYLIQLRQFLLRVAAGYIIDRGLGTIYAYNTVREGLLFCAIQRFGIELKAQRGNAKAAKLVQVAKTQGMISKATAKVAQRIVDHRNDLHPDKQVELHTKVEDSLFEDADAVLKALIKNLRAYFTPDDGLEDWQNDLPDECAYCTTGVMNLGVGQICPACATYGTAAKQTAH